MLAHILFLDLKLFEVARYVFTVRLCPGRIYWRIERRGRSMGVR